MQNQGDFKLCASSTDVVKRLAVIKSVIIKRVHCICMKFHEAILNGFVGQTDDGWTDKQPRQKQYVSQP